MSKKKTINSEPYNLKSNINEGIITLTFYDMKKTVNVKLSRWWIAYIARELHKIIKSEQDTIDQLRENLKNG